MSRSNILFGTLCLAFVIYITLRGQLPEYLGLFSGKGGGSSSGGATPTTPQATTASPLSGLKVPDGMQDILNAANNMLGTIGLGGKLGL